MAKIMAPWNQAKEQFKRLTTNTPAPKDDDDDPPYKPAPVKRQNDKLYDTCIFIGVVMGTCLVCSIVSFAQEQVNDFQARAYFHKIDKDLVGEHALEIKQTYKQGLFLAAQLLCEDNKQVANAE